LDIGLCRLDAAQGRLRFAGARIALQVATPGGLVTIAGDKQPIGYHRSSVDFAYRNHDVAVEPGMMCYLASDGILDQSGGPQGWGFGRKRLGVLLADIAELPAARQKTALEGALADYRGVHPQRDDITIIGFRL
jgi:serine phosphatase RsbU (regulator of sigma subunit)